MTFSEQAKHLINVFSQVRNYTSYASPLCRSTAKECALICVDGLIEECHNMGELQRFNYWNSVKQELKQL